MTIGELIEDLKSSDFNVVRRGQKEIIKILSTTNAKQLIDYYIQSSEYGFKQNVMEIFILNPDQQYCQLLIDAFQSEKNEDLKFLISVALGKSGNEKIINHLVSLFDRNDFVLCQKAMLSLKAINKFKPLIDMLKEAKGQKLYYLKETLKRIENVKADLLYSLIDNENPDLSGAVLEVMGTIRTKENVFELLKYLNNYNSSISDAAADGLFVIGESISEFLGGELLKNDISRNYMKYIPEVLAKFGQRGQSVLSDVLKKLNPDKEYLVQNIASNIDYTEENVERLIELISSVSVGTKLEIAKALSAFGEQASALYYKKLYEVEDKNVKAVILAGFISNEEINQTIINEVYNFSEEDELRKMLKYVIAHTAPSNAMNLYTDMLRSTDFFEREVGVDIIENMRTENFSSLMEILGTSVSGSGQIILNIIKKNIMRLKPFIINLLKEGNDTQKISAAFVVGELKIDEAVNQLVASTKDGNEWVRKYSFRSLKNIKGEEEARRLAPDFNE
ncbi:MAG: HEAT repeat domain-containing protein [Candidatus Muiribacteriota bacterium]